MARNFSYCSGLPNSTDPQAIAGLAEVRVAADAATGADNMATAAMPVAATAVPAATVKMVRVRMVTPLVVCGRPGLSRAAHPHACRRAGRASARLLAGLGDVC